MNDFLCLRLKVTLATFLQAKRSIVYCVSMCKAPSRMQTKQLSVCLRVEIHMTNLNQLRNLHREILRLHVKNSIEMTEVLIK